jgi:hypothetical protein
MPAEYLSPEDRRRQAALQAMDGFAEKHGATDRTWEEVDDGNAIQLVGRDGEGRPFRVGYAKTTPQEAFELGVRAAQGMR